MPTSDEPAWMREWRETITASVQKLTDAVETLRVTIMPRHEVENALSQRVSTDQHRLEIDHLKERITDLERRPVAMRSWMMVALTAMLAVIAFCSLMGNAALLLARFLGH